MKTDYEKLPTRVRKMVLDGVTIYGGAFWRLRNGLHHSVRWWHPDGTLDNRLEMTSDWAWWSFELDGRELNNMNL